MLGIAEVPDIPEALGMLMLPDALAESGIFTLLDEDGALDPDRLEDNDVIFLTSGISGVGIRSRRPSQPKNCRKQAAMSCLVLLLTGWALSKSSMSP